MPGFVDILGRLTLFCGKTEGEEWMGREEFGGIVGKVHMGCKIWDNKIIEEKKEN